MPYNTFGDIKRAAAEYGEHIQFICLHTAGSAPRLLPWSELKLPLDTEVQYFYAWSESWVFFVETYDATYDVGSVPRYPVAEEPSEFGG